MEKSISSFILNKIVLESTSKLEIYDVSIGLVSTPSLTKTTQKGKETTSSSI